MRVVVVGLALLAACGRYDFAECDPLGFIDDDGDAFGGVPTCNAFDPRLVFRGGDCDDTAPDVHPEATDDCLSDRDCDGTWSPQVPAGCPTIQPIIDRAVANGLAVTVHVAAIEHVEDLVFVAANVTVVGEGVGVTTLRGNGRPSVAPFDDRSGGLADLTITNGHCLPVAETCLGGGVLVRGGGPTLTRLEVTKNTADGAYPFGGAMSFSESQSIVSDLDVHENVSNYYGAGIDLRGDESTFDRIRLTRNTTAVWGGAIASYYSATRWTNVVIADNQSSNGSALLVQGGSLALTNATIIANRCNEGCALYAIGNAMVQFTNVSVSGGVPTTGAGAVQLEAGSTLAVAYSNFFANSGTPFVGFADPTGVNGNVGAQPLFVDTTSADPLQWNLHLMPTSSLIDKGDPSLLDPDGTRADIGAFGGPGTQRQSSSRPFRPR